MKTSNSSPTVTPNKTTANSVDTLSVRLGAVSFAIAGILFVLYPLLRPFSNEKSLEGASAFGSSEWLAAHMMAMIAFTLLILGLFGVFSALRGTTKERAALWALIFGVVAVGLLLPFYGGEAFGLYAIGHAALTRQDGSLTDVAAVVRGGAGEIQFLIGLLLLAASSVFAAVAVWETRFLSGWSAVLLAIGLCLYLPQFFGNQPIRVIHGLVVAVGCLGLGLSMWRSERQ